MAHHQLAHRHEMARPSPSCAYDDDRLRLPPASPARNSKAEKKLNGPPPQPTLPAVATPSSNSSLDYRRSDARIVENGFATSGGLSKLDKVVRMQSSVVFRELNCAQSFCRNKAELGCLASRSCARQQQFLSQKFFSGYGPH